MSKVLLINGQGQQVADTFNALAPAGFEIAWIPASLSDAEKITHLRDVEFVVLHPAALSGAVIGEAKALRLIQLLAAGYEKVDMRAAAERGIPVATNGGANAWAVAEHAIALMLALYKRLIPCDRSVRAGEWRQSANGFNTFEMAGKTVGIIGAGNIGRCGDDRPGDSAGMELQSFGLDAAIADYFSGADRTADCPLPKRISAGPDRQRMGTVFPRAAGRSCEKWD